jgi:hypothetical protein
MRVTERTGRIFGPRRLRLVSATGHRERATAEARDGRDRAALGGDMSETMRHRY